MIKRKIQAFTIMEVTITMLISALVIGITYTAFSIITRSYHSFDSKHQDMAVVLRLDELLQKDFNHAEIVLKDTDGIALRDSSRTIKYRFNQDYILRVGITVDTFKVKSDSVSTIFENNTVNETGPSQEANRLDELGLNIILQNEKIPYHYHKIYSSANLINRNPNAVN
jgi:type II secretory pathway component PulJ